MIGEMFANNPWLSQNATQVGVVGLTQIQIKVQIEM